MQLRAGIPGISRLIISAPMGNWLRYSGVTSTIGTFTLARRPGRLWQILRTLRYSWRTGAFTNKLGLRNPGIKWLRDEVATSRIFIHDKILSIHGFNHTEWNELFSFAFPMGPAAVELNYSCPNVVDQANGFDEACDIFKIAREHSEPFKVPIIVKVSPITWEKDIDSGVRAGLTNFHCFNTLPVPGGGMSGRPLMALYPQLIKQVRARFPDIKIIAGGGVRHGGDMLTYRECGADHVAVGSGLFFRSTRHRVRGEMATHAWCWDREATGYLENEDVAQDGRPADEVERG